MRKKKTISRKNLNKTQIFLETKTKNLLFFYTRIERNNDFLFFLNGRLNTSICWGGAPANFQKKKK